MSTLHKICINHTVKALTTSALKENDVSYHKRFSSISEDEAKIPSKLSFKNKEDACSRMYVVLCGPTDSQTKF